MKAGWQTKRLSEVCLIQPPKSEARKSLDGSDIVSFVPMDCLGIGQKYFDALQARPLEEVVGSYTYFADGDVLLAKITPCFENGKLGIARNLKNGVGFGSSEYIVFRGAETLHNQFLYYFLSRETFREEGAKRMTGAVGHKRVAKDFIENSMISLPPLPEQQRIVAILDEAFEGITTATANAKKNLNNARELFDSTLQYELSCGGKGWLETTLGEETDLISGFPFKSASYSNSEKDVRLLRGDNIIQGSFRWDDVKRWSASDTEAYKRYNLNEGDVVLAMDRPWVNAGLKRAQITSKDLPCMLVQRTARLRGTGSLDNRFLLYLINSQAFIRHILGVQTGIGVPHISGQQIKDFQFLKPLITEQQAIVAKLDELSTETKHLEAIYQQKLTALDDLKKSLLQQAFSGELQGKLTS
jgi:type I restriction enzyme, S subunit